MAGHTINSCPDDLRAKRGGRLFMGIQPTPVMRVDLRPYPPATTIHKSG